MKETPVMLRDLFLVFLFIAWLQSRVGAGNHDDGRHAGEKFNGHKADAESLKHLSQRSVSPRSRSNHGVKIRSLEGDFDTISKLGAMPSSMFVHKLNHDRDKRQAPISIERNVGKPNPNVVSKVVGKLVEMIRLMKSKHRNPTSQITSPITQVKPPPMVHQQPELQPQPAWHQQPHPQPVQPQMQIWQPHVPAPQYQQPALPPPPQAPWAPQSQPPAPQYLQPPAPPPPPQAPWAPQPPPPAPQYQQPSAPPPPQAPWAPQPPPPPPPPPWVPAPLIQPAPWPPPPPPLAPPPHSLPQSALHQSRRYPSYYIQPPRIQSPILALSSSAIDQNPSQGAHSQHSPQAAAPGAHPPPPPPPHLPFANYPRIQPYPQPRYPSYYDHIPTIRMPTMDLSELDSHQLLALGITVPTDPPDGFDFMSFFAHTPPPINHYRAAMLSPSQEDRIVQRVVTLLNTTFAGISPVVRQPFDYMYNMFGMG